MAHSKSELFDKQLQKNAEFCKALSHPARLAIIKYLAETQVCITGDITEKLPLGRTTVNQHLMELKRVGIIQGKIHGNETRYCLDPKVLEENKELMIKFFNDIGEIKNINN